MTTLRADFRTTLYQTAVTYSTANPTLLRAVYRRRPPGFAVFPCAYVGKLTETVESDASTRRRVLNTSLVVVDNLSPTHEETASRMDVNVDGLLNAIGVAFRAVPSAGPMYATGVEGGELAPAAEGAAPYEVEVIGVSCETSTGTP